ncbi:hypothetical protein HQ520_14845, partial [bacterium]|nr:hypothetical protein [bacterium]
MTSTEPYKARVVVDLTKSRAIRVGAMEKSRLDRDIYFRSYHPLGMFSEERNRELAEIGALPARGCLGFNLAEDPGHPGKLEAESVGKATGAWVKAWQRAAAQHPGKRHAMAHGRFPEWMTAGNVEKEKKALLEDWERLAGKNILARELYETHADVIVEWFRVLKENNCSVPSWYTTQNEPINQWDGRDFAVYTRTVAERMRAVHPEVKVCGPCSAWPYPTADFSIWRKYMQEFIEEAGASVGAYDLHFYSKGHWALPPDPQWQARRVKSPSLYENQKMGNSTVWEYGRLEGYLDLVAAYHVKTWGGSPKPMTISEFGRQTIHPQFGPWTNEFKYWLYMTTVIREWMTYMERPEVELTVPFILGESDGG